MTWAGIVVCADLSPAAHICDIATTAQKRANLVLRAFISRDVNTLVRAYLVYVRPLLEYDSIVWSTDTVKDIAAIEGVQRRFAKNAARSLQLQLSR